MSARDLLARMSLREKCAQLVWPRFSFDDPDWDGLVRLARTAGVGGVVLQGGSRFDVAPFVNSLQKVARLPLLAAAAFAQGVGGEVAGATVFPSDLAVAAAANADMARSKARLTARESRAMGVRVLLGHGAEAFGDDPALAAELAGAYAEGAAEMRVLAGPPDAAVRLGPPDAEAAIAEIEAAVAEGRLSDPEVYAAAEAVLAAKQRVGLFGERIVDQAGVEQVVGAVSHGSAAERLAEAAVTRVRGPERLSGPVALARGDDAGVLEGELARRVGIDDAAETAVVALRSAEGLDLVRARASRHRQVVVVVLGDPRLARELAPEAGVVCAYGADVPSQRAAARALAGEIPFAGRLPVRIDA